MGKENFNQSHSSAWVIQTWLSFILSIGATSIGIIYLPVDIWIKGYMEMGLLFSIGSTVSLTKTQRDLHESSRIIAKLEEAKVERILASSARSPTLYFSIKKHPQNQCGMNCRLGF